MLQKINVTMNIGNINLRAKWQYKTFSIVVGWTLITATPTPTEMVTFDSLSIALYAKKLELC